MDGKLEQVPASQVWKDIIIEESQWFTVDELQASKILIYSYQNSDEFKRKGKSLMDENREKFTLNKMTEKLGELMKKYAKDLPQQVGLNLPKLKKVKKSNKDETPKIKLPKLKKVTEAV